MKRHPLSNHRSPLRLPPAFTLIEMVTSMAIAAILMLAIGSAMVLASRALPSADSVATSTLTAANAVDKIAAELRYALTITERASTALAFAIPDRDGDGKPELIRYAWSGTPGSALTRRYNNTTAVTLLDGVQSLSFTCRGQTIDEKYPGPIVEGDETLLVQHDPSSYMSTEYFMKSNKGIGQVITPVLPADTYHWRLTRFLFRAMRDELVAPKGILGFSLHDADPSGTPTGTALVSGSMTELSLGLAFNWVTINVSDMEKRSPSTRLSMFFYNAVASSKAGRIEYSSNNGTGLLFESSGLFTHLSDQALRYQAFGRVSKVSTRSLARNFISAVDIAVQTSSDPAGKVETAIALPNKPETLSGAWETNFSENPTTADTNSDGVPDWTSTTGFDTSRLTGGVWRADRTISSDPVNSFTQFTTIEVAMRDSTIGGNGAALEARVEATALGHGIIEVFVAKKSDGTQTLTLQTRTALLLPQALFTLPGLPAEMVQLKLYINPADDSVGVVVNDIFHGSYTYNRSVDLSSGVIRLSNTLLEDGAEFDHLEVRVGGAP